MNSNWQEYNLSDAVEMISDKVDVKDVSINEFISTQNLLPNLGGIEKSSGLPKKGKVTAFKQGDVLFSNIRTYFRKVWQASFNGACSNDVIVFRGNNVENDFLYYILADKSFIDYSTKTAKGTKMPRGDKNAIKKYIFNLPPLHEQKAIAQILRTLDDKIELNRKMNKTLEQMAQALFKSWFVDFDPVLDNAIAKGNSIPDALQHKAVQRKEVLASGKYKALPKEILELFPSSFEYNNELDKWIPEGWSSTNMFEELETISKTYPLKEVDKIIFLNTGDIQNGKFLHDTYCETKGLPGQAKKSIQEGDILYSEIRPRNKRFAYVHFNSKDYVVSTKLMVLRPKKDIKSLFYYQILTSQNVIDELQFLAESRSGTFPQITFDTLKHIDFVLPKERQILDRYIKSITMYFEKSIVNSSQIDSLIKQRDVLLPQLISGKLKIELKKQL